MLKIGFIGAGTVGTALALLLSQKGYQFVGASRRGRRPSGAVSNLHIMDSNQAVANAADLIFITTPDDAIVHCSGADSVAILEPARKAGAQVGGFHPLQTFAGIREAVANIPGSTFGIEAEEPLLTTLKAMAEALGGHWIRLEAGDKVAYHAAAVFACNYLVTLVKMATDLWQTFNIPPDRATQALLPLIRGTLHNIETIGIPGCLTGPIARGDTGTISKHLKALGDQAPALLAPYRELGLQTVPIARAKGKIDAEQAKQLEAVLQAD